MSLADRVKGAKIKHLTKRILIFDIERVAGTARLWEPKTRYVSPKQFTEWPRTICVAAKWYGEKDMLFHAEWDGRDEMIRAVWDLFDRADVLVGYNSQRFDVPHLNTEFLQAGLTPPRPFKQVDLYRVVKQRFGFESASLDSVTTRLGLGGKNMAYSMSLADQAVAGDVKAQKKMRLYNQNDVKITTDLYDTLRPWIPSHPFTSVHGDEKACPRCGSTDLKVRDTTYAATVIEYLLLSCLHCGGHVRAGWVSRQASTRGVA